jgi:ribonuclease HI
MKPIMEMRKQYKDAFEKRHGAEYKSFLSLDEAEEAFRKNYSDYYQVKTKEPRDLKSLPIQHYSIAVDAACSGNPGVLEYQ